MKIAAILRTLKNLEGSEHHQEFSARLNALVEWENAIKAKRTELHNMKLTNHVYKFGEALRIPSMATDEFYPSGQNVPFMIEVIDEFVADAVSFKESINSLSVKIEKWAHSLGYNLEDVSLYDFQAEIERSNEDYAKFERSKKAQRDEINNDEANFNRALAKFQTELGGTVTALYRDPNSRQAQLEVLRLQNQLRDKINGCSSIEQFLQEFPSPTPEQLATFNQRYIQR